MALLLNKKNFTKFMCIICIVIFLGILSQYNFLLFHIVVEFTVSMISYTMMAIILHTSEFSKNNTYTFLGISYVFIGSINLLHTIAYRGMNIVNVDSINMSIQLSTIARGTEAITLFIAFMFTNKEVKYNRVISCYSLVLIYSITLLLGNELLPKCYVPGVGITKFELISEYAIAIILITSMYFLRKNKNKYKFMEKEYNYLMAAIIFTIISQVFFTIHLEVHRVWYSIGHIFKLVSFYYIYVALIIKNLKEPYDIIFCSLNKSLDQLKKVNESLNLKNNELEKMKNDLEENLRFYKEFAEVLPLGVIIRDEDTIVYVNDKTKELLKLNSKKNIIGKSIFDIIEDRYKTIVRQRIDMEDSTKIEPPIEEKFICEDGSLIHVEVTATSVIIDNKEFFMDVLKDISYFEKLKVVQRKLEEKAQYETIRNEFFANISHELRTPVNVIYSALQLEEIYFNKKEYDKVKKNNKVVKQNCMRLLRLINNLIDITKIEAGFFKPVLRYNNIVELVENIVLSIVVYVESRNMNIIFDTELEEMYVNCDGDLIERIMLNLLSNSIKYGKSQGCIYVNIYNDSEGLVSISVKDNGIGIPKDKQDKLFQRFTRIDKAFTRTCEGSGIGLSLVKSLVEIQNGIIELNSEEDVGTEIIVKFPMVQVEQEKCILIDEGSCMDNIVKKVNIEFSDIYEL
ncbi:MASE3 domain-containing sensor histidine kinase [Clostridium lundense]|uniref:sensor histidine kinase n=1 Tax=Clostridium lundense TaxID=319475 RepID=UPI000683F1C1|nr:MASE3 domain-containing protein [Clostridium lundense]